MRFENLLFEPLSLKSRKWHERCIKKGKPSLIGIVSLISIDSYHKDYPFLPILKSEYKRSYVIEQKRTYKTAFGTFFKEDGSIYPRNPCYGVSLLLDTLITYDQFLEKASQIKANEN